MSIYIKTIQFKRKKNDKWESGIFIECNGNANNMIIDNNGNRVGDNPSNEGIVHDYKTNLYWLYIDVEPILKSMNNTLNT